jgi:uncharacterized membrane protein YbhN (UPF0104 family)
MINVLKMADWRFCLVSTIVAFISIVAIAMKFHLLIRNTQIERSIVSLTRINFIARFYALFLPGGLGQEVVRWYKVTGNEKGRTFFLASIFFERIVFVFTLLITSIVPFFLYPSHSDVFSFLLRIWPIVGVFLFFAVIGIAYFVSPAIHLLLQSFLTTILQYSNKKQKLISFFENFAIRKKAVSSFVHIFALNILFLFFL